MNELSWLIYAADVTGKVGVSFGVLASLGGVAVGWMGVLSVAYSGAYTTTEEDVAGRKKAGKVFLATFPLWVVIALIAIAAPSKDTVYAIAASEMGERVIQSETAGKAVQALNAWLDRQIAAPAA